MLYQGSDSVLAIMGVEGVEEFFELVVMTIVVVFFVHVALQFARRSRRKEAFEVEKKVSLGYCFYFLSLAISYGAYHLDRTWRYLFGDRFFMRRPDSLLSFDYFLVMFFGLNLGFVFLTYVIEKHVLNRRVVLSWVCIAGVVFTVLLRPIEAVLLPVSPAVAKHVSVILFVFLALVLVLLVIIYVKVASMSPPRSDLWNRSVAFLIGTGIMVVIMVVGVRDVSIFPTFGPFLALASLFIMQYGLSRAD